MIIKEGCPPNVAVTYHMCVFNIETARIKGEFCSVCDNLQNTKSVVVIVDTFHFVISHVVKEVRAWKLCPSLVDMCLPTSKLTKMGIRPQYNLVNEFVFMKEY